MIRIGGMRATVTKVHPSGHVDVHLYRGDPLYPGDQSGCVAVVEWHGMPMCYRVTPTAQSRNVTALNGLWCADMNTSVSMARGWE